MTAIVTRRNGGYWHVDAGADEFTSELTASYTRACLAIAAARTIGVPVEVRCDCRGPDRYDVVVGDVVYRGALVHGSGGEFRRGFGALLAFLGRAMRDGKMIGIYVQYSAETEERVMVAATEIDVICECEDGQP